MVVSVGVCCMDVKLFSRPMAAILNRLRRYDDVRVVPFGNRCIFEQPVEDWPIVDFLICFYSAGFPLSKAEDYVRLRDPICFNDVLSQHLLLDRTAIYSILRSNGIPIPTYEIHRNGGKKEDDSVYRQMLMDQKNDDPLPEEIQALNAPSDAEDHTDEQRRAKYWGDSDPIRENEDCITVNGRKIQKPFVEKPVWAEDHNIFIYYPRSSGGGSKRLFRKIGDRSSKFVPNVSTVRRGGSFIYENFIATDGLDIKVYTVGPDYAHAEARKAPTLDGRVKRAADGKEVRYHVILTQQEKEIARKITQIFGQTICGFDILRSDGMTYVCDVNGWSFVKGSPKYYNDCAQIIYEMINYHLHPLPLYGVSRASVLLKENDGLDQRVDTVSRGKELRCLLAVIRHSDRTPKQKVKVTVSHPLLLAFFEGKDQQEQVKLKSIKELETFAKAIADILEEDACLSPHTSARNRAPDSTARPKYRPPSRAASPVTQAHADPLPGVLDDNARRRLNEIHDELRENDRFSGINRKVQLKPAKWRTLPDGTAIVSSALLIFKFGGQLTDLGTKQADYLGKRFRQQMYPADRIGMLSLHSSFSHDIKFYASDEGRVQMTAAVFAKAFLELDEEEVIPILYALVWNDKRANLLLEHSCSDCEAVMVAKRQLAFIMNSDVDFSEENTALRQDESFDGITVEHLRKLGLGKIGNPYKKLKRLLSNLEALVAHIRTAIENTIQPSHVTELQQRVLKMLSRIAKSFYDPNRGKFDISKVPEIADFAKFLYLHTPEKSFRPHFKELYDEVLPLAMWVVPQEYGLTEKSKLEIAEEVVRPLVDKLVSDLRQMRERKQLQTVTRFYFTSESHVTTLFNLIEAKLGYPISGTRIEDYVSTFVFKLHEDMAAPINDPKRFICEVWHSQGSNAMNLQDPPGTMHNFLQPLRPIRLNMVLDEFIRIFSP